MCRDLTPDLTLRVTLVSPWLDPDSEQKPFITRSAPLPHIHTDRTRAMPVTTRTTLGGSAPDAQQGASSTTAAPRASRDSSPPRV